MLPAYKYTEITSKNGNSQLIYIQYKKRKPLLDTLFDAWDGLNTRKQHLIIQKLLGLGLFIIGIIGCLVFPEDAGGFVFAGVLGILRLICND